MGNVKIIFSDIDGTFVHYPKILNEIGEIQTLEESDEGPTGLQFVNKTSGLCHPLIALPTSSTGQQGYLSLETLKMVRRLREEGIIFVIISGARYATILERYPFMPLADAVVVENGGRIFEPDPELLTPLKEDAVWRATHAAMAGSVHETSRLPEDRQAPLWDVYRKTVADKWSVDARSYTTLFRIKGKGDEGKTPEQLQEVLGSLPEGLATSVNLGMADVYPATSGKHNAARYITEKRGFTADQAVCMCDDDNDLEMAAYVSHAYLPGMSAASVREAVAKDPSRFSVSSVDGVEGTHEALCAIMERVGIHYEYKPLQQSSCSVL